MQDFLDKKILIGVCGGIAAYKTAYLVRELIKLGAKVRVVMTEKAQEFITPLTFQALTGEEVRSELFNAAAERGMSHIELARWADIFLIAPATANCLGKFANGLADDLLSTLYLVCDKPVLVCPAMNRCMWEHPATQNNVHKLQQRGVIIIGPESGEQACGEVGFGRMSEVDNILSALRSFDVNQILKNQKIIITAGPTRENIDPIRYISNRSSGKMGFALAQAAQMAGAQVTLISGPTNLSCPPNVKLINVETAQEMYEQTLESLSKDCIFIGTAAVADFGVKNPLTQKFKKTQELPKLDLSLNPDILASVARTNKAAYVIGFAAETENLIENALKKLKNKKLDMIIANQVGGNLGFETDFNQVTLITNHSHTVLPFIHKTRLASQIIAILAANLQNVAHVS